MKFVAIELLETASNCSKDFYNSTLHFIYGDAIYGSY